MLRVYVCTYRSMCLHTHRHVSHTCMCMHIHTHTYLLIHANIRTHSHTHTHTHTHTPHANKYSHISLFFFLFLSLPLPPPLSLSLSLTYTHTHTHTQTVVQFVRLSQYNVVFLSDILQACTEITLPEGSNGQSDMFPVLPFTPEMRRDYCIQRWGVVPRPLWSGVQFLGRSE